MAKKSLEADWKHFRKCVPEWRERYLKEKNSEMVHILTDANVTSTEQFWNAKNRIDEEAKILVTCLDGHSRSSMQWHLFLMYQHGLVKDVDLKGFSDGLQEHIITTSQ